MSFESTIDDILKDIPRFRILCAGRSGVGKSSLINRIFGIEGAKASHDTPGEATIDDEFASDENVRFVLHDSEGFESGNEGKLEHAIQFLRDRRDRKLPKDRLHAIWFCVETPRAGGRVLEKGDGKFLVEAHACQIPVVVVFTKYDFLVSSKELELEEDGIESTDKTFRAKSEENASKAYADSVALLNKGTTRLKVPTLPHAKISISEGYEDTVSALVVQTRDIVRERLKGDAWVTWAIAQRASLPAKIEACVDKGINSYYNAFTGCVPAVGDGLLWKCLAQVHQDIITCWNFRDEAKILVGTDFKQLVLYLVEDVQMQSKATSVPALDRISQFVSLVNASTVPIAPPVAILGLTYFFVKWIVTAVLEKIPKIECLLMAYTLDLISVLRSLFDMTLKPDLVGTINWNILKEAFDEYEHSKQRGRNHTSCRSIYNRENRTLTREDFRKEIKKLLDELSV